MIEIIQEVLFAFVIGLIQGLTEFIPVSSTAHMRIIAGLLSNGGDIGQDVGNIIQMGTIASVLVYFWNDINMYVDRISFYVTHPKHIQSLWKLFVQWVSGHDVTTAHPTDIELIHISIGTIPIIIISIFFKDLAGDARSYNIIAGLLIFGSFIMMFGEYMNTFIKKTQHVITKSYGLSEVLLVGLFQSFAIFPGVSRSGATVSGTLLLGKKRSDSVRFAFLLSIPAVLIAGLYGIYELITSGTWSNISLFPQGISSDGSALQFSAVSLIIAVGIAYISGYYSLKWLIPYISNNSFTPFIIYRTILAVLLIVIGITV